MMHDPEGSTEKPYSDPTAFVYCPIHKKRVPATYGTNEYGQQGYSCYYCAFEHYKEAIRKAEEK